MVSFGTGVSRKARTDLRRSTAVETSMPARWQREHGFHKFRSAKPVSLAVEEARFSRPFRSPSSGRRHEPGCDARLLA